MKFHNHSFNDNLSDIIITVTAFEIETMLQTSDITYSEWQVDRVYCYIYMYIAYGYIYFFDWT
jgi:hypothetical protein